MNPLHVEAIYEHGTLKLPAALPLQEGQKVSITIHTNAGTTRRRRGLIDWKGSQEDLDYLILSDENDPLEDPGLGMELNREGLKRYHAIYARREFRGY